MSTVKKVYKGIHEIELVQNEDGEWREVGREEYDDQTPKEWAAEHSLNLKDYYANLSNDEEIEAAEVQKLEEFIDGSWVAPDNEVLIYPLAHADYVLEMIRDGIYVKVIENEDGQWVRA